MKKWWMAVLIAGMLCGCGAQPVFETVNDDVALLASAQMRQVMLELPQEAAKPVLQSADGSSLYMCNGYTLTVQTFQGGDLDRTTQQLAGFTQGQLRPIQTQCDGYIRYDLAWAAAGEGGDQIARAVILDDGVNHYAVAVMADGTAAGDLQAAWQKLLGSVRVE